MKRAVIILLFALTAIVPFGCQPEQAAVEAKHELKGEELLAKGEIAQVELSEAKGVNPIIYDETEELEIFRDLFSNAEKELGIVNMGDPEFYLKVIMEDGEKRYLNLWLGGEGETASLMNIEDAHTIYTVMPAVKSKLTNIIEKKD